nr:hypothetical protein Q903MT_gene4481 [Picea sitchensis]
MVPTTPDDPSERNAWLGAPPSMGYARLSGGLVVPDQCCLLPYQYSLARTSIS